MVTLKTLLQSLLISCLLVLPASAADIQMQVRQDGSMLTVEGKLKVAVNPNAAWAVLTDYARYPEFVPGINSSRILEQRGNLKLIEQRGVINGGQIRMPFQGAIQVAEHKRDDQPESIMISFISGPLKDVQGEWNIQPAKPLELAYSMKLDLMKSPFPPPMAVTIIEQQVRTWVEAFANEMQAVKRKKE